MENNYSYNPNNALESDDDDDEVVEDSREQKKDEKEKEQKRTPKRALFFEKDSADEGEKKRGQEKQADKKAETKEAQAVEETTPLATSEDRPSEAVETTETEQSHAETASEGDQELSRIQEAFSQVVIEQQAQIVDQPNESIVAQAADEAFLETVEQNLEQGVLPEDAMRLAEQEVAEGLETQQEVAMPEPEDLEEDPLQQPTPTPQPNQPKPQARPTPTPRPTQPKPPLPPPVRPPTPPTPPIPVAPPQSFNVQPPFLPNQNVGNVITPSNSVDKQRNTDYETPKRSSGAGVAGIAGYLLGKRVGRKRTEEKLEPIIEKQEETIQELTVDLHESEERIKNLSKDRLDAGLRLEPSAPVAERASQDREESATVRTIERVVSGGSLSFEVDAEGNVQMQEPETRPVEVNRVGKILETVIEKRETETVVSAVERPASASPEVPKSFSRVERDPRTMSMVELLQIAERINVESMSLRELYQNNRIDAANLRRVVIEYMQGGSSYERLLRGSLEAVETRLDSKHEVRKDGLFSEKDLRSGAGGETSSAQNTHGSQAAEPVHVSQKPLVGIKQKMATRGRSLFGSQSVSLTSGTAIVLGILTGIVLMVLIALLTNVI